jgi:hypothetical protein
MKWKNIGKPSKQKKVVDLNDKSNIIQLSHDIERAQHLDTTLTRPIHDAISVLKDYDECHDLTINQIRKIYAKLNINEQMTPEQMDDSLRCISEHVAILEKKFLKTSIEKEAFSILIRSILQHFTNIVAGNILGAITEIIENFSCICLMARQNFSYKDVCFKFFTRHPDSEEVLVLVLNIHYEQFSLKRKILDLFKYRKERIHLNFLGALVKTDIPEHSMDEHETSVKTQH